ERVLGRCHRPPACGRHAAIFGARPPTSEDALARQKPAVKLLASARRKTSSSGWMEFWDFQFPDHWVVPLVTVVYNLFFLNIYKSQLASNERGCKEDDPRHVWSENEPRLYVQARHAAR